MAEFYHAYLRRKKNTDYWQRKKEQLCELTGTNVENWKKYQAQMVSHICGDLATDLFVGIGAKTRHMLSTRKYHLPVETVHTTAHPDRAAGTGSLPHCPAATLPQHGMCKKRVVGDHDSY